MKPVQIENESFDIAVIDNAIVLQGLHRDIVIEDGYTLLKDEARQLWCKSGRGFGLSDFISQYCDDNIESFIMEHYQELGKEVVHYNN